MKRQNVSVAWTGYTGKLQFVDISASEAEQLEARLRDLKLTLNVIVHRDGEVQIEIPAGPSWVFGLAAVAEVMSGASSGMNPTELYRPCLKKKQLVAELKRLYTMLGQQLGAYVVDHRYNVSSR